MMARAFPWSRLGIDPTDDASAIRKAYADALRATNIDEDIAGYADLRRARDHALWLAAEAARALADDQNDDDLDDGAALGLGSLDDDDDDGAFLDAEWTGADEARWQAELSRPAADPLTLEPEGSDTPELTEAQRRAQEAWGRLLAVMYPQGEASEDAVTHDELDEGTAALAILIARAEEADLVEHDALDGALAELFARTWPRSAPFVEPANAAFHWLDEAGSLEERPALRFLNQRLKGMRFHEKVQASGHPLHRAWTELTRPGRAGMLDRLKVKRLDVHKLLTGIRTRYPELESHLDPERVASWEGESASAAEGKTRGGGFSTAIWLLIVVVAVFRVLVPVLSDDGEDKPDPASIAAVEAAQANVAVASLFGAGVDMDDVKAADAIFAGDFKKAVKAIGFSPDLVLAFGRQRALQAGAKADFEGLVARGELKRLWLAEALGSPDQCQKVLRGDFAAEPLLALDDAGRQREQALFKRMLDARALGATARQEGGSFGVPGWVIEQTVARSGLSRETVSAALRDPAHASRCAMELAMLDVILKEPGKVPVELLRAL